MTDKDLRQCIIDELDFEPSVNAAHVGVAVENGVVTLSGHVVSYVEKLAAEAATRRVKGVRGIAEDIRVRYPSDKKTADDEITKRALDILRWSIGMPDEGIQVTVQDGVVTLGGQVDWQYQKIAAADAVRSLSGIVHVINNITISPRVQPLEIRHKIEEALKRHIIEAQHVHVMVLDGGKIALQGDVHHLFEREEAERVAWSMPGVMAVDNQLMVI
jgi:osmotically-inducible protein OsmY